MNDIVLGTPTHACTIVDWAATADIHQLCADTGCSQGDLSGMIDDRDRLKERESGNSMPTQFNDEDDDMYIVCTLISIYMYNDI